MNHSSRIRQLLIVFVVCQLAIAMPQPHVRSEDDVASDHAAVSGLGIRQRRYVADRLKLIEARIASLASDLQKEEPERAKKLALALERMGQMTLQQRTLTIAALLDKRELEHATEQQQAVLKDLAELLSLLSDDSETDRLADRVRELREWKEQLLALREDETEQLDNSDKLAHPEAAMDRVKRQLAEVSQLIQRQQELIKNNQNVRATDLDGLTQVAQQQDDLHAATERLADQIDSAPLHRDDQNATPPGDKEPGDKQPGDKEPGEKQPGETQPGEKEPGEKPKPPGLRPKNPDVPPEIDPPTDGSPPSVKPSSRQPGAQRAGSRALRKSASHQSAARKKLQSGRGRAGEQDQKRSLAELRRAQDELADARRRLERLQRGESNDLADRQDQTARDTQQLSDQIRQSNRDLDQPNQGNPEPNQSPPGQASDQQASKQLQKAVKDAQQNMQNATQDLQQQQSKKAGADQQEALKNLDKGIDEIERQLKDVQDELNRQRLASLIQRFQQMLARQKDATEATALAEKRRAAKGRLQRSDAIIVRRLSEEEQALAQLAQEAADEIMEDGSSAILPQVANRLHDDLVRVADRLDKRSTGPDTNTIQIEIEWTLEELIEALQQAQRANAQGRQGGGNGQGQQPGKPKLIPDKAELKLLRAAQRRINRLTSAFDQQQGEKPLDDLRRRELRIIAERQAEVRRMAETLTSPE